MEKVLFLLSLLFFLTSIGIMIYVRKCLLTYTTELSDCLQGILDEDENIDFKENQDTLVGKLMVKMRQIYEILIMRSQENLYQRESLESMISDISHQLKTPIASIRMYHNLLERKELEELKRDEFLSAVEKQVDKLEFFMNSMIRMSRLESGIVKVNPRENSVYELIAQAVCDAALKAEEKDISIGISCSEELLGYFDRRWTGEALFNILDNGVKYTNPGGHIEISAEKAAFYVRIKIKDNGRGIRESHIPMIFKRFYREPESVDVEGVGIGLYLAREIMMKQKGFLEVRSKEGEGTEVLLNLPADNAFYNV